MFEQAVGLADRARDTANTIDTRFNIGSINKTFTSIAVAQLAEAGRMEFDAPIGTYLPDYPNRDAAGKVTIHHLLTHSAGLPPYMSPRYMAERDRIRTLDDLAGPYGDVPARLRDMVRQILARRLAGLEPRATRAGKPRVYDGRVAAWARPGA